MRESYVKIKDGSGCEKLKFYQMNPSWVDTYYDAWFELQSTSPTTAGTQSPTPVPTEGDDDDYKEFLPQYEDLIPSILWGIENDPTKTEEALKIGTSDAFEKVKDYYGRLFVTSEHTEEEFDRNYRCVLEYKYNDGKNKEFIDELTNYFNQNIIKISSPVEELSYQSHYQAQN